MRRFNLGIFIYWWVCTKPINWAVICMCVMGTYIDSFVSVPMIFLLYFESVLTVWQFSFYDLKCWRHHQCILAYPYMLDNCGDPCYSQFKSSGLSFSFCFFFVFVVFVMYFVSNVFYVFEVSIFDCPWFFTNVYSTTFGLLLFIVHNILLLFLKWWTIEVP